METFSSIMTETMGWLGKQPKSIFLGQAVKYPGTFMSHTLAQVPEPSKMEFPVCEQFQMQFTLGLSLEGYIPISIYPRFNFLLLATGDLLTLNNWREITGERPHIIIRTATGVSAPVYPGIQHVGDFTNVIRDMCPNINVVNIKDKDKIYPTYNFAYRNRGIWLLVEDGDQYSG